MKLTLLGTGTPQPNLQRRGAGQIIDTGNSRILVDCGAGILHRLVEAGYPELPLTMTPQELGAAIWADPEAAMARMPKVDPEDREAQAKGMLEREKSMSATGKFIWPIADKGLKKRIHRIKAPTLIVWGEQDGLIPPVYGPLFQKSIRGSQLVTIPSAGHVPMVEQPDAFLKAVTGFLG